MSSLANIALKYEGFPTVKYRKRNTGNTPKGFDCSGFVQWVVLESGISIPNVPGAEKRIRRSGEFFDFFGFLVHEQFRQQGDLVFFSRDGCRPSHLGIYIGDGRIIHSLGIDDLKVSISSIDDFVKNNYPRFNPLFDSKEGCPQIYSANPIGYKRAVVPSGK